MRSFSRPKYNSKERGRSSSTGSRKDGKRSESKEDSNREYNNCIGCKCESCVKMRKNAKEMNVNLCEGYAMNDEFLDSIRKKESNK